MTSAAGTDSGDIGSGASERIRRAAYELFSTHGTRAVGVDAVVERAGAAKMTLYRNFPSKDDLILDFLERREQLWTDRWLRAGALERSEDPAGRLLAVFDLFGEWFARPDFEGCAFLTTMVEYSDRDHPVRQDSVARLARVRGFLRELAEAAGVADAERFADQWHLLMKGSIMAAHEGDTEAAAKAGELGAMLLRRHGVPVP